MAQSEASRTSATAGTEFLTFHEIMSAARVALPDGPWDYLVGGTETETTVRRSRQALDSLAFRPRVLNDVRSVDASRAFLGARYRPPRISA